MEKMTLSYQTIYVNPIISHKTQSHHRTPPTHTSTQRKYTEYSIHTEISIQRPTGYNESQTTEDNNNINILIIKYIFKYNHVIYSESSSQEMSSVIY